MIHPAELILLILDSSDEPIAGRTAVQKIAYFNSVKLHFDLKYRPLFYGPFSPVVDENLIDLIASDYVDEKTRITFRDRTLYTYALTEDGSELVNHIRRRESRGFSVVKEIADECNRFGNNINILSCAAKVHFLFSRRGHALSHDEAIKMGRSFNWELSESDIDSGVELLTSLGLGFKLP